MARMPGGRSVSSALLLLCAAHAHAADRFVSTLGSDTANTCIASSTPCRTIGNALAQAASGDVIKVAQGNYTEDPLAISGNVTLTISGGWAADFGSQSTVPTTRVRARPDTSIDIHAAGTTGDVTLDTLTLRGTRVEATSSGTGTLTVRLINSLVVNNTTLAGGAIRATSFNSSALSVLVIDSTLKSNRAGTGGAIYADAEGSSSLSLSLVGSTVQANVGGVGGGFGAGGISAYTFTTDPAFVDVSVQGCTFLSNRGNGSGAIDVNGRNSNVTVVNSVFRRNKGGRGGAIRVTSGNGAPTGSGTTTIVNSTFSRNRASVEGGAVWAHASAGSHAVILKNTVLWGNSVGSADQDLWMGEFGSGSLTVDADHSDIGDRSTVAGTFNDLGGNIDSDPRLTPDLHLHDDSPAIDAGTCTGAPATDFDGDLRPVGAGCDIGADEFVP